MAIAKKELEKPTENKTAKVETQKTEIQKAEPTKKAELPKAIEPAKESEPKAATVKETAVSKPAAEKKTAAAEKKTTARKSTTAKKNDIKTNVVVEYDGKQINSKDIIAAAKKAFTKANKGVVIKTIDIYVQPEENVAYYVVNGHGTQDDWVSL